MKQSRKQELWDKGYKFCSHCNSVKKLELFHSNTYNRDNLANYCKVCQLALVKIGRDRKQAEKVAMRLANK